MNLPHRHTDWSIKGGFMLLAGMALPPIQLGGMSIIAVFTHVILITIVSNIGKCVPMLAYRDEATLRERLALSVGMFPRGEVGIGVLLVSLEIFRQQNILDSSAVQQSMTIGALSLALEPSSYGSFHHCSDPVGAKANHFPIKARCSKSTARSERGFVWGCGAWPFSSTK